MQPSEVKYIYKANEQNIKEILLVKSGTCCYSVDVGYLASKSPIQALRKFIESENENETMNKMNPNKENACSVFIAKKI